MKYLKYIFLFIVLENCFAQVDTTYSQFSDSVDINPQIFCCLYFKHFDGFTYKSRGLRLSLASIQVYDRIYVNE